MGVLGNVTKMFSRGGSKNVNLTELGKQKYIQGADSGIKYQILTHLNDFGESSIREIAEKLGYQEKVVRTACESMQRDGWIEAK